MRLSGLDQLPGSARIWVFGCERPLSAAEAGAVLAAVDDFLESWAAHGVPLSAARSWRYDRFLIVGVDGSRVPPSGCSIDALARSLRDLGKQLGVGFLDNEAVWYRDAGGKIQRASRPEFRALAHTGDVTPSSVVFDNSLTTLTQLRAGMWEGPAADRWQAVFF